MTGQANFYDFSTPCPCELSFGNWCLASTVWLNRDASEVGHKTCDMEKISRHIRAHVFADYVKKSKNMQTPDGTPLKDDYLAIEKV